MMAATAQPLLVAFEAAATAAGKAETTVRKRAEAEIAAAERDRAFAYRRLNRARWCVRWARPRARRRPSSAALPPSAPSLAGKVIATRAARR
jgi:hypothetical protein